jgi:hypothetical protein
MLIANLIVSSISLTILIMVGAKAVLMTRKLATTRTNITTALKTAAAMQQKRGNLQAVKTDGTQG